MKHSMSSFRVLLLIVFLNVGLVPLILKKKNKIIYINTSIIMHWWLCFLESEDAAITAMEKCRGAGIPSRLLQSATEVEESDTKEMVEKEKSVYTRIYFSLDF